MLVSLWATSASLNAAEPAPPQDGRSRFSDTGCSGRALASFPVRSLTDFENVLLDDGREYNIGLLTASLDDEAARTALHDVVAGRTISIFSARKGEAIGVDRYGRLRGEAMVQAATGSEKISLQRLLIARGLARVTFDRPLTCGQRALLKAEDEARRNNTGHWATGVFSVLDANDSAAVAAHIGQFAIIEGKLRRTSRSRKGLYLNFGRNWRKDVTVLIPTRLLRPGNTSSKRTGSRNNRADPPAKKKPNDTSFNLGLKLTARPRLRTRGWIEQRGGPLIEIRHLGQIELVE